MNGRDLHFKNVNSFFACVSGCARLGQMESLSMAEAIADVRVMLHNMISVQSGKIKHLPNF